MEISIYDQNFNRIRIIDIFESLIWTKRYNDCGDFELSIPLINDAIPDYIQYDYYVKISDDYEDGYLMIIENIEAEDDVEGGPLLIISGRSLEAILDHRIVWDPIEYVNKSTWFIINDQLKKSITNPTIKDRYIANFYINDPSEVLSFSNVDAEYDGDSLLTVVKDLCDKDEYSFSVRANILKKEIIFSVYKGENRSLSQIKYNPIIFSRKMDTMYSAKYLESVKDYKNVIRIVGENNMQATVGTASGINRREYKENAGNVTDNKFLNFIGSVRLKELDIKRLIEVDKIKDIYVYGVDYFMGDIVQVQDVYGINATARVMEVIISQNDSGSDIYPTLKTIE